MEELSRDTEGKKDRATAQAQGTTGKEALGRGPGGWEGNFGTGAEDGGRG